MSQSRRKCHALPVFQSVAKCESTRDLKSLIKLTWNIKTGISQQNEIDVYIQGVWDQILRDFPCPCLLILFLKILRVSHTIHDVDDWTGRFLKKTSHNREPSMDCSYGVPLSLERSISGCMCRSKHCGVTCNERTINASYTPEQTNLVRRCTGVPDGVTTSTIYAP